MVAWLRFGLIHSSSVLIKKTEGLELGAVDKLLVGIFAGRDGEEKISSTLLDHHYSFLFIIQ